MENYLYGVEGNRARKTVRDTHTDYRFPHYEVTGNMVTKYYFLGEQHVAMQQGTVSATYTRIMSVTPSWKQVATD